MKIGRASWPFGGGSIQLTYCGKKYEYYPNKNMLFRSGKVPFRLIHGKEKKLVLKYLLSYEEAKKFITSRGL